jgi:thymidine kinase
VSLTVVTGPMFSGKTDELLRRVRRARHAKKHVALIKPLIDNRYSETDVVSHNGLSIEATPVDPQELRRALRDIWATSDDVVNFYAIDEIQFFDIDQTVLNVIEALADRWEVVIAGLDMDFRGQPFEQTMKLMAVADHVIKFPAVCDVCGMDAARTQRVVNGEAVTDGAVVQVGGEESYEARCRGCFVTEGAIQ